ncbi:peptidase, partial [Mammaliicoccus vitulinus]
MSVELEVNNKVLSRYIQNSNTPIEAISKRVKSIDDILDGKKNPTFNQLSTISKMINIPTGLLILDDYIEPYEEKLDFRTVNSSDIEEMSSELKDTIKEMRVKQDFLKEEVGNQIDFINKFSINDNYQFVA